MDNLCFLCVLTAIITGWLNSEKCASTCVFHCHGRLYQRFQTQSHHSSSLLSDINVCEQECVRNLRNKDIMINNSYREEASSLSNV